MDQIQVILLMFYFPLLQLIHQQLKDEFRLQVQHQQEQYSKINR